MKVSAELQEAEQAFCAYEGRCKLEYQNNPWVWKKYSLWSLASLFLKE